MKKFVKKVVGNTVAMTISLCLALGGSYAWFTASNEVSQSYSLTVEVPESGLEMTAVSNNGGTLAPATVSGGVIVDANGNASSNYYEATYTLTTEKAKAVKLTGLTVTGDIGNAIRVQTGLGSSAREFAPEGRTATNAIGDSIGVCNKTATLVVRIYLDGTDADCVNDNAGDVGVTLTFGI